MRRRATARTRWGIAAAVIVGLIAPVPAASWVYAELARVQYTPWVWIAGVIHRVQPDALYLAGLAGVVAALAIPAFTAWALLRPKPLHGEARLARARRGARGRALQRRGRSDARVQPVPETVLRYGPERPQELPQPMSG